MKEKTAITYYVILGKNNKFAKKQEFGMVMSSLASFSQ